MIAEGALRGDGLPDMEAVEGLPKGATGEGILLYIGRLGPVRERRPGAGRSYEGAKGTTTGVPGEGD